MLNAHFHVRTTVISPERFAGDLGIILGRGFSADGPHSLCPFDLTPPGHDPFSIMMLF